jgi:hypothetical protein
MPDQVNGAADTLRIVGAIRGAVERYDSTAPVGVNMPPPVPLA